MPRSIVDDPTNAFATGSNSQMLLLQQRDSLSGCMNREELRESSITKSAIFTTISASLDLLQLPC